jgi:hypothetical protein
MSRRLILIASIGGGILAIIIAGLLALILALRYEPKFYREALSVEAAVQEKASDEMLQRMSALVSNVQKTGKWRVLFTAEQINGWLAVDVRNNHPDTFPPFMDDPRADIEPDRIVLACRYEYGIISTVLTLTVKPYLAEKNTPAVQIISARAGLLPLPLGRVLDAIADSARRSELRLEWSRNGGDPVGMFVIPPPPDAGDLSVKIETIRTEKGKLFISGSTERK